MVGYGIAGVSRRFLVWPSFAIWPGTLSVLGLSKAFHSEANEAVPGPFGTWRLSRQKFFLYSFLAMFVWYWFPGYIFTALSSFSWMTWIAPENPTLDSVTGFFGGVGLNPWPTFDWNNLSGTFLSSSPSRTVLVGYTTAGEGTRVDIKSGSRQG